MVTQKQNKGRERMGEFNLTRDVHVYFDKRNRLLEGPKLGMHVHRGSCRPPPP